MTAVEEILKGCDTSRFQKELADFIVKNNLKVIVETGTGISSLCILKAWDDAVIDGKLYSIDPAPWMEFELKHPKYNHIKQKSIDSLASLYSKTGPWDLFLHDGNHDILCQTYEYRFAYACLKEGGWIVSDDTNWGNNGAWGKFIHLRNLQEHKMGTTIMAQKKDYLIIDKSNEVQYHELSLEYAVLAERKYLEAGGRLTPCFQ